MKFFYLYNLQQSNYFISNGIEVLEVGRSKKDGSIYLKFPRNEKSEEVFSRWCNRFK